jgi:acyl-CoA synthetase (AMP-forming)/AMP-acid ligase II
VDEKLQPFDQSRSLKSQQELIKVRGFQVAPPELEAVLLDHPQIVDAAVIGVKSADGTSEYPRGYVVKRPGPEGDKLTHEDVHSHINERLIHYKRLTGGLVFTSDVSYHDTSIELLGLHSCPTNLMTRYRKTRVVKSSNELYANEQRKRWVQNCDRLCKLLQSFLYPKSLFVTM